MITIKYKWKGISDEVLTCSACGRNDLKRTIVLENEYNEVDYFGCCCASKILSWSYNKTIKELSKEVNKQVNIKKKEKEEVLRKAKYQYNNHPNIIKINSEIAEMNRLNIPFNERKEKLPYWNELKKQAKQEIISRFNLSIDIYL